MTEIIKTGNLTFSYPPDEGKEPVQALKGVDLSIVRGSVTVILGHNGSGKSTLAKHMNAVLLPVGGKVWVDGMDTSDEDLLLEVRRRVGMVFQNPDNQIVANVVEEDVAFGPENLGVPTEEIQERVGYEKYDIVAANILADVLVELTPVIVSRLKPGGIYITSGIIDDKEQTVVEAVERAGLEVLEVTYQGEWVSVTARK